MKHNLNLSVICIALVCISVISSCSFTKGLFTVKELEVPLQFPNQSVPNTYRDLDKTVRLNVISSVSKVGYDDENLSNKLKQILPEYVFVPSIQSFAQEATTAYMQQMRFDVSYSGDYSLNIDVKKMQMWWEDKQTTEGAVQLTYSLTNSANETIVPTTSVSSRITMVKTENFGAGLGRAYAEALRKIDWDRIADCLRTASSPKQEKNAQVTGEGTTALEHTVIRWYIISSPQGADVSWRVVSSTPDVANTNSNFVGSTPYESTESFDIKGLTYNNSGNVQIEVTCEKAGYLPQRKRFNLRQAIDQKEISAKFNLIKED